MAEVGSLTAACQELWVLLHSASNTASGIPQQILDEKAEEMRKKKEMQDAINVSTSTCSIIRLSVLSVVTISTSSQLMDPASIWATYMPACTALQKFI